MPLLDLTARQNFLSDHPEWWLGDETITRTFQFSGFSEAIGFVTRVALLSEVADHHPDIDIRWNKVTIALTTHSEGGLTDKDIRLAAEIDGI